MLLRFGCPCEGEKNAFFFDYFFSAGDVAVNDPSVSVESSQFSSEVLVTQVKIIIFASTCLYALG